MVPVFDTLEDSSALVASPFADFWRTMGEIGLTPSEAEAAASALASAGTGFGSVGASGFRVESDTVAGASGGPVVATDFVWDVSNAGAGESADVAGVSAFAGGAST